MGSWNGSDTDSRILTTDTRAHTSPTPPSNRLCLTHCLSGCPCPSAFRQPRNGTNGSAVLLSLFLCVHGLHLWSPFSLFYDLCAMAEAPPSVTRSDTSTSHEKDEISRYRAAAALIRRSSSTIDIRTCPLSRCACA